MGLKKGLRKVMSQGRERGWDSSTTPTLGMYKTPSKLFLISNPALIYTISFLDPDLSWSTTLYNTPSEKPPCYHNCWCLELGSLFASSQQKVSKWLQVGKKKMVGCEARSSRSVARGSSTEPSPPLPSIMQQEPNLAILELDDTTKQARFIKTYLIVEVNMKYKRLGKQNTKTC